MAHHEEALKYLLGLETFPSCYEISQASDEELEERVNNWQEQIFTLAGQLHDLQKKLESVEKKNIELESSNDAFKKQVLRLQNESLELKQQQKYSLLLSASHSHLVDNQFKTLLDDQPIISSVEIPTSDVISKTGRVKSQDFRELLKNLPEIESNTKTEIVSSPIEPDLLQTKESLALGDKKVTSDAKHSKDGNEMADSLVVSRIAELEHQLNESLLKLRQATETIMSLERELQSQKEFHQNSLEIALKAQKEYYEELLEKKSYLPTSFESLDIFAPEDLTFVVDGSHKLVKSGSIRRLVDYLADPSLSDIRFLQIFVFSFHMFMESKTFLKMILSKLDQIKDTNDALRISRLINVLKFWIDNYFEDFERDSTLIGKVTSHLQILKKSHSLSGMAEMILKQIDRKMTGAKGISQTEKVIAPPASITYQIFKKMTSIKKKNMTVLSLYTPEEFAKQLTLLDFKNFSGINIREFLELNWMRKEKISLAPGITQLIKWSNHISFWVATEILTKKSVKERVPIMEFMINLAHSLEKLNNFHGMANVLCGLNTSPVYRLRKTKESLSSKCIKIQESLEELTSTDLNYKKQKISLSQPPLIPFLGIYQGDLVFLDSTGSTMLENDIVNYQKVYRMASHVIDLKIYQNHPYYFSINTEIQNYISNYCSLSEEDAYAVSLAYEPRS